MATLRTPCHIMAMPVSGGLLAVREAEYLVQARVGLPMRPDPRRPPHHIPPDPSAPPTAVEVSLSGQQRLSPGEVRQVLQDQWGASRWLRAVVHHEQSLGAALTPVVHEDRAAGKADAAAEPMMPSTRPTAGER